MDVLTGFLCLVSVCSLLPRQLCGKLHHKTRHANIKRFREENVSILISSLKAGGVGLDLTMASKCILVDLWWNEAIEQQVSNTHLALIDSKSPKYVRHFAAYFA